LGVRVITVSVILFSAVGLAVGVALAYTAIFVGIIAHAVHDFFT